MVKMADQQAKQIEIQKNLLNKMIEKEKVE
jgi:hypothetical protein